jgi:pyridoxal 5'-phosphate synthase pdxS subunit
MSAVDTEKNFIVKAGLARMLKGGVIMDVINVEQAKIAEAAGAVAVMALERIPADIRYDGGVARMSDPQMIMEIRAAVTIPVMAKVNLRNMTAIQPSMNLKFSILITRFALVTSSKPKSSNHLKLTT